MRKIDFLFPSLVAMAAFCFVSCAENKPAEEAATAKTEKPDYGGFESQIKWGEHLVTIAGCNDCHTPKIMTPQGPADDTTRLLSGHPASMPSPDVDRKQMESKGLVVTSTFTSWVGPWGITYSANLTPDETGLGTWTEDQFIYAIKNSVSKGLPGSRPLFPPMSLMPVKHMSTDELKAVFSYLRTIKPISNISVQPTPPVLVMK
ncbi:MAG TPA: diheme cytochrome c-553 [Cyclobacteriaceae bacterium]|nr:diheme cytochrome c-553 [Cyclobacteriaceae bacterium]